MNDTLKSYLSAAAGLVLVTAVWAFPATRAHRQASQAALQAQQEGPPKSSANGAPESPVRGVRGNDQKTLEATGKIASVAKSEFTVEVQKPNGSVDPVTFTTDKDSAVNGKIVEGATADVTYRVENGKNIVVRAHITPPPNSGS